MNDIKALTDTLSFVDGINKFNDNIDVANFNAVNELTNSFMKIYELEDSKLPYHISILDLIWANENAHSRIFAKLLQQNSGNEFEVLDSFLKYLNGINYNFNYSPRKPEIKPESERIDLLILDTEYALIIENKIHYATDQGSQLARYINKVKQRGYKEEKIYIIYLTRDDNKKPEDQSWKSNGNDYKESFAKRYIPLSFKTNILPWLKDHVLPNCKVKDVYLKSTIEQYIDYLEGMFKQRTIDHKMNSELQKHIEEVLKLNSAPDKNYAILQKKLSDILKVEDQIKNLIQTTEKDCWKDWLKRLKTEFPNYEIIDHSDDDEWIKVGVIMEINKMKFAVLIEKDDDIYYGIASYGYSDVLLPDLKVLLNPFLEELKYNTSSWYGFKNTSFINGYKRLSDLIKAIEKYIELLNQSTLVQNYQDGVE